MQARLRSPYVSSRRRESTKLCCDFALYITAIIMMLIRILLMMEERCNTSLAKNSCYVHIYPVICLKSVCLATFAECSSEFWLNRLGRCLKLTASTRGTFCYEFASQFGVEFFYTPKNCKPLSPAYFDPRCGDKQRNWKPQNGGISVVQR